MGTYFLQFWRLEDQDQGRFVVWWGPISWFTNGTFYLHRHVVGGAYFYKGTDASHKEPHCQGALTSQSPTSWHLGIGDEVALIETSSVHQLHLQMGVYSGSSDQSGYWEEVHIGSAVIPAVPWRVGLVSAVEGGNLQPYFDRRLTSCKPSSVSRYQCICTFKMKSGKNFQNLLWKKQLFDF